MVGQRAGRVTPQDMIRMLRVVNRGYQGARRYNNLLRVPGGALGAAASAAASYAGGGAKRKRSSNSAVGSKITARGGITRRKSKKSAPKKSKSLKSRVKNIEKDLAQDLSYKFVKNLQARGINCIVGKSAVREIEGINSGTIRTSLGALDIGTGTAIDGRVVAENTQISIEKCWCECVAANVTDSACYVTLYALVAKSNTNDGPEVAYADAILDSGMPAGPNYSVVSYPTQLPDWKKLYRVVDTVKGYLRAGDQLKLSFTIPDFKWSDDYYDNHPFSYIKGKNMMFLARVEGDIAVDASNPGLGSTMPSAIMLKTRTNFQIAYAGNVASRVFEVNDSLDVLTTPQQVGPNVINIT